MKPMNQRTKKDGTPFEPEIPLWRSKTNADVYSTEVTPEIYDMIQKLELGGRLFLKRVVAAEGKELSERAPTFRLSATSRAENEAFRAKSGGSPLGKRKPPVEDVSDDVI